VSRCRSVLWPKCPAPALYWIAYDYFKSDQRRIRAGFRPDLGTQIQPQPESDLGRTFVDHRRTIRLKKLMASTMMSAAVKRKYSSVLLCYVTVCKCLTICGTAIKVTEHTQICLFFPHVSTCFNSVRSRNLTQAFRLFSVTE